MIEFARKAKVILVVALAFFVAGAAHAKTPEEAQTSNVEIKPDELGVDEKLGAMIALDVQLHDEDGRPVALKELVDRPTILTLNYFRCAGICSPQLNGLADAINMTHAEFGKAFRVVTVSFDERDTPEVANRKRSNYLLEIRRPASLDDWRFLTGDKSSTRRLADSVGFKFKKVGEDYAHAGAAIFLSPKGVITRYMYGTSYVPADIEMAVNEAKVGQVQPTINRWLKFCFSYDPAGRRYALDVTRIVGTMVLGAALAFAVVLIIKGQRSKSEIQRKV